MSAQTHHHAYESCRNDEDTGKEQQRQPSFPLPVCPKHPDHGHRHTKDHRIGDDVEDRGNVEVLRLECALIARIWNDLPVLLNWKAAAGKRQEDREVGETCRPSQPSEVSLQSQAGREAIVEEQDAGLEQPDEGGVGEPNRSGKPPWSQWTAMYSPCQSFETRAYANCMYLLRCHLSKLLLREVQVRPQMVRKSDGDGIADIAQEHREGSVIVSLEVAYADSSEPDDGPEDENCYAYTSLSASSSGL